MHVYGKLLSHPQSDARAGAQLLLARARRGQVKEKLVRAIFLSYRRDDAEGEAGRLFDDLVHEFGANKVFMDVTGIEPGRDFRKAIDQNVSSCGVLLAMMGKGWIDAKDDSGRRRLDDPLDFVRLETASALKRDIPVIPVLVHGGRMPRPEQLPDDLRDLAYRNGVELTHARWDSDVHLLIEALRPHVSSEREEAGVAKTEPVPDRPPGKSTAHSSGETGVSGTTPVAPVRPGKKSWRGVVLGAVAAIVIAAGVIGAYEYIKAEEAKVKQAATEAAAKQADENRRVAAEKEAARRAAEQEAADQAAARRAAADKSAARRAAAEKAAADKAAAEKAAADKAAGQSSRTWKMNPEKSKYSPGPAPKNETVVVESDDTNYEIDATWTNAYGNPGHAQFSARFDGKDYPATGIANVDSVSVKRIDANTIEQVRKKDGKVVMTITSTVSRDGKTATATWRGRNVEGKDVYNVVVYDKQ